MLLARKQTPPQEVLAGDLGAAPVEIVDAVAAEAVDVVTAEPTHELGIGTAPEEQRPRGSIWKQVMKIVRHETTVAKDNAAVQVAVSPAGDDGWHNVEVLWDGRPLIYNIEGEISAKAYGLKVANLILDGRG